MWWLLVTACVMDRQKTRTDVWAARRDQADALFVRRADFGVDPAVEAWTAILARFPEDSRALARLAQAEWIRGLADPTTAVDHFRIGEEFGFRCLLSNRGFAATLSVDENHLSNRSVRSLEADALPCMEWAVVNQIALVQTLGPGAALHLESAALLLDQAERLAGADTATWRWAAGQLALLREQDEATARSELEKAVAAAPESVFFRLELGQIFPEAPAACAELQAGAQAETAAWALENRLLNERWSAWRASACGAAE